ncbi:MAG: glycosyltransferase family 39 protein [Kiritimatiellia bacterium]
MNETGPRLPHSLKAAMALGLVLRLIPALTTVGTQDVLTWLSFRDSIVNSGLIGTYSSMPHFNHPPLVGLYLYFTNGLSGLIPFAFAIRLPAILADTGTAFLVYRLLKRYTDTRNALWSAVLVSLSPFLIPISGFHGNTDPVFVFLIVLAAYCLAVFKRPLTAGLVMGLALNVKIAPVLALPVFFFWIRDWRERLFFCGAVSAVVLTGYGPVVLAAPEETVGNIFYYGSFAGFWGVSLIGKWLGFWSQQMTLTFRWGTLAVTVISALFMVRGRGNARRPEINLLASLGWVFVIFLVLTPGFGPQYLAWLTLMVFCGAAGFAAFSVLSGIYVIALYTYWCGGFPWYYADPTRQHPALYVLSLAPWAFLLIRLCVSLCSREVVRRQAQRGWPADGLSD